MKRYIFLFFSLVLFLFSCSIDSRPEAENGVIDLSSWDFTKHGKISLAGEWEFYWGELLLSDKKSMPSLPGGNRPDDVSYINVPSNWRYYCLFNGIQYHAHGQGTYRLKVIMNTGPGSTPPGDLYLYATNILFSFRIFINSMEIVYDPGIDQSTGKLNLTQRFFTSTLVDFPADADQDSFYLTIQVLNPENTGTPLSGGIMKNIFLGTEESLVEGSFYRVFQWSIWAGAFFLMFLYHLFVFLRNRQPVVNLFLSLMCLTVGLMVVFFDIDIISFQAADSYSKAYYDYEKLFLLLECILLVLGVYYFGFLFREYISGRMFIGFTFICFLLAGFILLLPPFPGLVLVTVMLMVLIGGYLVFKSFHFFSLERKYPVLGFAISFFILYLSVLSDILITLFSFTLDSTFSHIIYPGFIIFLIINTYYLSAIDHRSRGLAGDRGLFAYKGEDQVKELFDNHNKLMEQDRAKTSFFVNASYELRTPLTVIRLSLDEILNKPSGQPVPADHPVFLRIQRQCDKLLRYINNLLEFSSLELNMKKVQMKNFDIKAVVAFFVSEISSMTQSRNLAFHFTDMIKDESVVLLDFRLFETAFFNIIANAFKFTPAGGEIRITLAVPKEGNGVELSVTDTGAGIPEENLGAIFSWYSSVDVSVNKKKEGMGIGLAVTRKIIEIHKGRITVTSSTGEGSVFTIFLPFSKYYDPDDIEPVSYPVRKELLSVLTPVSLPPQNDFGSRPSFSQRILIIDDEPDLLGFLDEVLAREYTIFTANNGIEGISLLKNEKPDLIITDIMMPEMDGYEFVQTVRKEIRYQDIPVLFLTAKSGTEEKIKGLSTGAIDYICKPFTINELKLKIKNIMQFQNNQKDLLRKRIVDALYNKNKESRHIDYTIISKKYLFTPREEEVFSYLAKGLSNKEIGNELEISEATVKRSVSGVYKKMGVNNRLEFSNKLHEELNR